MVEETDKVRVLFQEALGLKDIARRSIDEIEKYLEAAERLSQAAALSESLAKTSQDDIDLEVQHEAFCLYYRYEERDCLLGYYYERRNAETAKEHARLGKKYITDAIQIIENLPPSVSTEIREHLTGILPSWKHFRNTIEMREMACSARDAWDNKRFVDALDLYRKMASHQKKIIDHPEIDGLEPSQRRIAIGNYLGFMTNASSAMSEIMLGLTTKGQRGESSQLTLDILVRLLKHTLDAYRLGNVAFSQNPEWRQYHINAQYCLSNIQEILRLNFPLWLQLYVFFENDPDFIKIMKMTDLKKFKEVERERHLRENKLLKLWGVGGFWLFVLILVAALMLFIETYKLPWWRLLLVIGFIEIVLVLIGALTLRTIGDLSEEGFIKLIGLAFRYQFRFFRMSKQDDQIDESKTE